MIERPVDNADIAQCTPDDADQLHQKDFTSRDLCIQSGTPVRYVEPWTYVAIHSQFQVLNKIKTFHNRNVAKVEEPNIGQYLSWECKTSHNSTEDININLHVGCCVDHGELSVSV